MSKPLYLALATLMIVMATATSVPAEPTTPVALNLQTIWNDGCGAEPATAAWWLDTPEDGSLTVHVEEPGHVVVLNSPTPLHIDPQHTPMLAVTYRATGLKMDKPSQKLMVFFGRGNGFAALQYGDLVADGQTHTLRVDLRERLSEQGLDAEALQRRFDLRVHADGDGPATLSLLDLRFEPAEGAPAAGPSATPAPLRVRVVDEAGQPIAGASVTLDPHLRSSTAKGETDARGLAVLTAEASAGPTARRSLNVEAEGRAPVLFTDLSDVGPADVLEARLYPAMTVGGRVVDTSGKPVAGAIGEMWYRGAEPTDRQGRPRTRLRDRVVTDQQGRWQSPPLPKAPDASVQVRWMHPDYLSDLWGGQYSGKLSLSDLIAGEAVSTLRKGVLVQGTVLDKQGEPLAGATVAQGDDRFPSNAPPATETDDQGRYRFANVAPGELVLTVTANGHAPDLIQTRATPGMDPINFQLGEPAIFRFRVTDRAGEPLKGVGLVADTWRGMRTLAQRETTDAEGRVTWQGPAEPVEFDIFARDKLDERDRVFSPTGPDQEHVVVLGEPLKITAEVVDAKTGQAIPQFTAASGILWNEGGEQQPHWQHDERSNQGVNGRWEQTFGYPYPFRVLRIEADGYAPAVSRPVAKDEGDVTLRFELVEAESLAGTVVDASGQPVSGAVVYLADGRSLPQVSNGRITYDNGCRKLMTDGKGTFSFPPQEDTALLVVAEDAGYVDCSVGELPADGRLVLEPWVTVRGQTMIGGTPAAGATVVAYMQHDAQQRRPYHSIEAVADEQGSFTLDRVPAGTFTVGRQLELSNRSTTATDTQWLEAEPGETLEVRLGGEGRPVTGQFVWPSDATSVPITAGHWRLSSAPDPNLQERIRAMMPPDMMSWTMEQRQAFALSEEGKALIAKVQDLQRDNFRQKRSYAFLIEDDGSFRIENVQPGHYALSLNVFEPPVGNQCGLGDPIGRASKEVHVPALPEGVAYLDEPVAVGEVPIAVPKPAPKVGEPAPAFTVQTLDLSAADGKQALEQGEKLSLADLSGRYVLLDFWAIWCGPCVADTPHLKAVWERFGGREDFAMVGLSTDQNPQAPLDYARANDLGWMQAYLGPGAERTTIAEDYAVRGIPSIWLIGPDGQVLAKDLPGPAVAGAVEAALKR